MEWYGCKDDYNSFIIIIKMVDIFEVRICRIIEYFMLMNILKYVLNYDLKLVK